MSAFDDETALILETAALILHQKPDPAVSWLPYGALAVDLYKELGRVVALLDARTKALLAYRSALRCREPESEQLRAMGDAALDREETGRVIKWGPDHPSYDEMGQ